MSSIKVYKSSPTSPSKGINKHISLGHRPESQWTRESIRTPGSIFQSLKFSSKKSLSQPQSLSPSGDYLNEPLVLFWCTRWLWWCSWRRARCSTSRTRGCRAVQPNPRRAHRQRIGLAGVAVWEHALHIAWCSELEGSSRGNKDRILSGVWLEEWKEELAESTSKRLQKLSWLSVCVVSSLVQTELSQILGALQ